MPSFSQTGCRQPYPTTTPSTNDSKNARCTLALTPHSLSADGVCFDYAVYALRSRLPAPLDLWSASHATRAIHLRRTKAGASASLLQALHAMNVRVVLGERVDLSSLGLARSFDSASDANTAAVRTTTGREIRADLVEDALNPHIVDPASGLARLGQGMQLALTPIPPCGGTARAQEEECANPVLDRAGAGELGRVGPSSIAAPGRARARQTPNAAALDPRVAVVDPATELGKVWGTATAGKEGGAARSCPPAAALLAALPERAVIDVVDAASGLGRVRGTMQLSIPFPSPRDFPSLQYMRVNR
ncbi:hypothetical protein B0H13DRAFT_2515478 [Mycena leptocephala]|nr:hypothetical protein B0H13DRAFT_2515478 [Mycena leptocephala]